MKVGDIVASSSGALGRIFWIGHTRRTHDARYGIAWFHGCVWDKQGRPKGQRDFRCWFQDVHGPFTPEQAERIKQAKDQNEVLAIIRGLTPPLR